MNRIDMHKLIDEAEVGQANMSDFALIALAIITDILKYKDCDKTRAYFLRQWQTIWIERLLGR